MDGGQQRMSIDNEKLPISPKAPVVHDPSLNQGVQINSFVFAGNRDRMQNGTAEAFIYNSKKLEDAMKEVGFKIKHHEDNIKFLKAQKNRLDDSILDMRATLGMIHSASGTGSENKESSKGRNEEETIEQILRYDKSAAGICCQLQTRHGTPMMKDVMGIVALLGKVDNDNLSRILSDYLGLETMLAVVCKTHDAVKALETYDHEGFINKSSGLRQLGASIGKPLDDRYLVICLEKLRPYTGEFIADDPQRRLAIKKPGYLNEETPGFLGFAVNMVNIDTANLYGVTSTGHGLRETLFYKLFSRLQVYKTRADMLQALPLITDGAVSLDGGIIKSRGVSVLGEREVEIKFPMSTGRSNLPENYFDTESRMKELEWKRTRFLEDLHREEILLEHAKIIFEIKKQEFVKFLAHSSSYVTALISVLILLTTWAMIKTWLWRRLKERRTVQLLLSTSCSDHQKSEQLNLKYAFDILGAVALLGEVRTHKLSSMLSTYLGEDQMFVVVCKSRAAARALENYQNGWKCELRQCS